MICTLLVNLLEAGGGFRGNCVLPLIVIEARLVHLKQRKDFSRLCMQ